MEGRDVELKNQTITIEQDKIIEIRPFAAADTNTQQIQVIDGSGKYLMPGLADMHVHFPNEKEMPLQTFFNLNLAAGVTSLRSMRGEARHLSLRDSIQKELIRAPDLYISTALPSDSSLSQKDLEKFIRQSKKEGWDFIKYLSGLSPSLFYASALISQESGLKLAGHVYDQDLQTAVKAGQASVEHYQAVLKEFRKDSMHFNILMEQLKEKNIFVCPTLSFYYIWGMQFSKLELHNRNGISHIPAALMEKWEKDYDAYTAKYNDTAKRAEKEKIIHRTQKNLNDFGKVLKRLDEAQVKVLLSPDESAFNVPGFAVLEEMKIYKKAGLSNYEILKMATYNAACFFNQEKNWGSIGKNKKANMILLDSNPLEDLHNLTNIHTVILHGKVLKPEDLLKAIK